MESEMPRQEVVQLLQAAIEASVYIAPTEPGLTVSELYEVGKRIGLKDGEIGDAMPQVATQYFGGRDRRLLLAEQLWQMPGFLIFREEPDLRNVSAFDFVVSQLNDLAREVGAGNAQLDRTIMGDRAAAEGLPRHDVEVAIALMKLSGQLIEENAVLRFKSAQGGERPLPSEPLNQAASHPRHPKPARTRVLPHVKDVIERRADGRPPSAEPFGAFAEQLEKLGYGQFRLWWNQTVAELGRTNPNSSPLSALILAAALVEGALTFTVVRARSFNLGVFGSRDFERDSTKWRIDDLVAGAARGGDDAILDFQAKNRADGLVRTRQRIHAGRMLVEFPQGVPDLRPEEAREAKAVAEQVVRSVVDWLAKHPPA
jgi:hypothetical protein